MIKGVIFDVDGVLLDSMPVWEEIGELYLKSQGREGKPGLREILFPMSLEQAADYLIREYDLPKTAVRVVEEVNGMIRTSYAEKAELKPGVRRYLESGDSDGCCNFERKRKCGSCISKTFGAGSVSGYFDLFGSGTGEKSSEDLSGGSRKNWYKTGRNVGI